MTAGLIPEGINFTVLVISDLNFRRTEHWLRGGGCEFGFADRSVLRTILGLSVDKTWSGGMTLAAWLSGLCVNRAPHSILPYCDR